MTPSSEPCSIKASRAKTLSQYLQLYAEEGARRLMLAEQEGGKSTLGLRSRTWTNSWQELVTLPAKAERTALPATLRCLYRAAESRPAGTGRVLAMILINHSASDAASVKQENADTWRWLKQGKVLQGRPLTQERAAERAEECAEECVEGVREFDDGAGFLRRFGPLDLWVLDAWSPGREFSAKRGVGLARKMLLDQACALAALGCFTGRFLRSLDADACVPHDYFSKTSSKQALNHALHGEAGDPVALNFPFQHLADHGDRAMAFYDAYLRYYAGGLRWAGSPYGMTTLGSCLAVTPVAYAQVRGVPAKREAGEDFYLLTKLAKLGPVHEAGCQPIQLSARRSNRVPFGTGPALLALDQQQDSGLAVEQPECFRSLRAWLSAHAEFFALPFDEQQKELEQATTQQREQELRVSANSSYRRYAGYGLRLKRALATALTSDRLCQAEQAVLEPWLRQKPGIDGVKAMVLKGRQRADGMKHLHIWFDGLRTRQWIKQLSESCLGFGKWV